MRLQTLFVGLLAACAGQSRAPGPTSQTSQSPTTTQPSGATSSPSGPALAAPDDAGTTNASGDASPPTELVTTAPPSVVVTRAPTVAGPANAEPVDTSGGRPSWLDGRGVVTPTKLPPLDVAAAIKARAAAFVPVGSNLPPELDYVRRAKGCFGRPPWTRQGAGAPPAAEIEAAIAQASDTPLLWHGKSGWLKGTIADAMLPLRGPDWAPLYLQLECMVPAAVPVAGGRSYGVFRDGRNTVVFASLTEDFRACPQSDATHTTILLSVAPDGTITPVAKERHSFATTSAPCVGRDTGGSGREPALASDPGSYFALLARDEAVSVGAFLRLAEELATAGAPAELVARARAAAGDEQRHAAAMARACRELGAEPVRAHAARHAVRPLAEVLEENAREGCVNETFAALVAARQAMAAEAGAHRELFAVIAEDERRHAELAWDVDAWGRTQVDAAARERIDAAREGAWDALARYAATRPEQGFRGEMGEPSRAEAVRLVAGLRDAITALAASGSA